MNSVVMISGGLGDIGRAIASEYSTLGYTVSVGDRAEAAPCPDWHYHSVDVTDPIAIRGWFDAVDRDLGQATVLIVNAAIVHLKGVLEITPEEWAADLRVNLDGAFYMAQEGAKRLVAAGMPGHIVFLGSWVAERADPSIVAYSASKAGVRNLMRSMARQLAPHDILVNEVAPGYVDAGVSAQVFREDPARRTAAEAHVPVRRLITAKEVAEQVVLVGSSKNRHMTGTTLLMDGGLSVSR